MFIAMNRFQVKSSEANNFESRWRERQSFLSQFQGFVRFWLLRAADVEGVTEFVSHSHWLDEDSFLEWLHSDQSKKSHSSDKGPSLKDMVLGPPQFKGYQVVMDQVPGDRVDARSMNVDLRVEKHFAKETNVQKLIRERAKEQGLPPINIGAFEGKLLEILLKSAKARVGVEIGTLGGYSTSWLCQAVGTAGKIYSCELDPQKAKIARDNLSEAGYGQDRVEVLEGPALKTLPGLNSKGPFDFVFIDADKSNYQRYCEWAFENLKPGGLIICDNAYIWGGMNFWKLKTKESVPECMHQGLHSYSRAQFEAMSSCWDYLESHPELSSLIFSTGDGMAIAVKNRSA